MTFPFLMIAPDGTVVTRIAASDLSDARATLQPPDGHRVVSAASHALPLPKPLARHLCVGCGTRPRADRSDYCPECQRRRRNDIKTAASERRGGTYGGARAGAGPKAKARPQSRHRPGYWRDYYADPERRERRNARQRQRRAA